MTELQNLLTTDEAAPLAGVSPKTLENWRSLGVGPKFIRTPGKKGRVNYDPDDLRDWRNANRYSSTSQVA
ncbi:MAG TPA: helix-turn-helix domain-containing protein [Sphingomicrobium sp.]|nr:helix-turn-helix domain-containing protein [Sphingomicrobium sp.]